MTEGPSTQIRLCGRLTVQIDGERIERELSGRQGRLLFAYLVLNRKRPVRRDELIEALWAEDGPPAGGDGLLAPPLSRLRKALGSDRLEGRTELQLILPDDAWIDVEQATRALERVRSALLAGDHAAVREPALAAVEIAECGLLPGLEANWVDTARRELAEVRVEALEALAAAGTAIGGAELPGAEQAARAAVEAAPFRESARLVLMEALRARGNIAEGLRVYEDLRTLLREELGTVPGPRVAALHDKLLRADSEPEPPPAARVTPAPTPIIRGATGAVAALRAGDGIVERDRELAELAAFVREAEDGVGRVVIIEGPAGIGKTRLLTELRRHAAGEDALVLAARGSALEREFSFGLVRQMFEGVVAEPGQRERLLAGAAGAARSVFATAEDPAPDAAPDASFAVLHGLFWLTLNVAGERPLVLALDDLQWADRPSLRFVAYLVRRLEGTPILVAATVRSGEPATDPALIGEIGQDPMAASIRPGPLSLPAVTEVVRSRLGADAEEAFCVAVHRATGGNPLLVRQLLSALDSDGVTPTAANADVVRNIGPRAVGRSVLLRLARLPGDAVEVARAVAVLGDHAELPAIAALAELSEESVAEATGALARAEILRHEPPIGFAHPLIQDAIYRELPPGERELQHSRAARVLAGLGGSPEQVAAHILQVPRRADPWAVDMLVQAGRSAAARGSADSAIAYLRRALDEPPTPDRRPDLLFELGAAEVFESADAAVEHLHAAYEELPDLMRRSMAADITGRIMLLSKPAEQTVSLMSKAIGDLADQTDPELVDIRTGLQAVNLLARHFGAGDRAALEMFKDYRDPPASIGPGTRKMVAMAAYDWSRTDGSVEQCTRLALRALDEEILHDDVVAVAALFPLVVGDHPAAVTAFDDWQALAYRSGSSLSAASVAMWRGELMSRLGDVAEAEESITRGFDQLDAWGHEPAKHWSAGFLARVRIDVGDLDGAEQALGRAPRHVPVGDGALHWLYGKIALMLAQGRLEEALTAVADVESRPDRFENPAYLPWRSLKALALDRMDRTDEALPHAEEGLRRARLWGAPTTVGQALRMLGTIERDAGIPRLEEAVATLEQSPSRLELAKALVALGGALRRARRPSEAREPLRRALEIADARGAVPTAEEARTELYATGARPRTEALSGAASLTASERRVVDLAVDGQTNRDIAQTLFVTPKTVEVHLSNAYRKLGIRSRRELADALAPAQ